MTMTDKYVAHIRGLTKEKYYERYEARGKVTTLPPTKFTPAEQRRTTAIK